VCVGGGGVTYTAGALSCGERGISPVRPAALMMDRSTLPEGGGVCLSASGRVLDIPASYVWYSVLACRTVLSQPGGWSSSCACPERLCAAVQV
jgi:hypothetical protein